MLTLFIPCFVTELIFMKPAYSRLMYITIKLHVYFYMFRRNSTIFRESVNQTTAVYYGLLVMHYTGLFISPSGISELDCATTKTDTAERSISIARESVQVFFVLGALAYIQVPPLGGSREEKWRSHSIRKRSVSWNLPKLSQL